MKISVATHAVSGARTTLTSLASVAFIAMAGSAVAQNAVAVRSTAVVPAVAPMPAAGSTADSVRVLLVPDRETTLSSPVAGRIRRADVTIGSAFGSGRLLIAFDCDEPVARKDMARAELAGAQETHEAKLRLKGLEQASEVEVSLAASAVAKARAQLALSGAQVAQCNVSAPWSGRVSKIHVKNHMSVNAGQPLVDLVKDGPLKLKLSVPSRSLRSMQPGTTFDIAIDETGKSYKAQVVALNSRIDPVSQTIEVEATMTQSHAELLAGMSGTARFAVAEK